jgi:predicted phosphodiesterase
MAEPARRRRIEDAVFHAGDLVHSDVLDALAVVAPVHAVLGNDDHGLALPDGSKSASVGA